LLFHSTENIFRYLRFISMGHPLWREDESVTCTIATRPCQRCHSSIQVPQNLRPKYFCLIWNRAPFSSPLTTRRAMVEVFYSPPYVVSMSAIGFWSSVYTLSARAHRTHRFQNLL
jgi:hypothetical protein